MANVEADSLFERGAKVVREARIIRTLHYSYIFDSLGLWRCGLEQQDCVINIVGFETRRGCWRDEFNKNRRLRFVL
jgi:hypothetical protein